MNSQSGKTARRTGLARFFSRGDGALLGVIEERIRREGKITFVDFMELALYHPQLGYYNRSRERIGRRGDFITGPETHPLFGALIARQLEQMWQLLGRPHPFHVVEMGAGSGVLCRDILKHTLSIYPELFSAIRYVIVESSEDSVSGQKALLRRSRLSFSKVKWHPGLSQLPGRGITGCFLSNELIDAFPVHRVVNIGGEIDEVYVGLEDGEFVDVVAAPSDPAVVDYFRWVGVELPEGCQAEVNLRSLDWMRDVAHRLKQGFVLTIDYGYDARELYSAAHRRGTLLCYYKHTHLEDPYVRVGQQDITAHVDFTALIRAGEEEGLTPLRFCTQRDFLLGLGLQAYVKALDGMGLGAVEYRANRLALEELIRPDDLGRLKVLVQGKGVETLPLPDAASYGNAPVVVPLLNRP